MTEQPQGPAVQSLVGQMGLKPFEVCVVSGSMAVRQALQQILTALSPLSLEIEEISTIELVLAEALNNIVEHAYSETQIKGSIHIHCQYKADGLHCTITDQGNPMPDGQMPLGVPQNVDAELADLPEGGYGWCLIKKLTEDIQYQRIGQENRLDLRFALGKCHRHK